MADGWTTIGELKPGDLFETRGGGRWELQRWSDTNPGCGRCIERDTDQDAVFPPEWEVRRLAPLEPVAVAPGIDPTLRGLLLHALSSGETGALFDWLTEAGADPDLARAVRENVIREMGGPPTTVSIEQYQPELIGIPPVNSAEFLAPVQTPVNSAEWLRYVPILVASPPDPEASCADEASVCNAVPGCRIETSHTRDGTPMYRVVRSDGRFVMHGHWYTTPAAAWFTVARQLD